MSEQFSPSTLTRDINRAFKGDFAYMRERLPLANDHRESLPCAAVLDAGERERIFSRYAQRYPNADLKGIVSLWTQWYFGTLVPPVVCLNVLAGHTPRLDLGSCRMVLDDHACPVAFRLEEATHPTENDGFARFRPFMMDHIRPLADALAAHAGMSSRVLWHNAAYMVDYIIRELARQEPDHGSVVEACRFLDARTLPDGSRNHIHEPVRDIARGSGTDRQRKMCCLRYLVPGVKICGDCPGRHSPKRVTASA